MQVLLQYVLTVLLQLPITARPAEEAVQEATARRRSTRCALAAMVLPPRCAPGSNFMAQPDLSQNIPVINFNYKIKLRHEMNEPLL